jgi:hypothetical protein
MTDQRVRKSQAIPGNEIIGCCVCFNENGGTPRVLAAHIVSHAGKSYGVCDKHLSADLPPVPGNQSRRTT